jgi:small subunit ribosomal protein S4
LNIPSAQVNVGDKISIREKSKKQVRIIDSLTVADQYGFPAWLEVNPKEFTGSFNSLPDRADLGSDINEQLVVELYSK